MLNIDDRLIREVSPKIGPNALSVLLAIAIHLNKRTGRAFPSHEKLMELTGMGKNTVYAALNVLKQNGLLKVEQYVDSKNKQFGRRMFRLSTRFISIFVDAEDVEPLPESREPESREPESREPESREPESWETYQLTNEELLKNKELLKNSSCGDAHAQTADSSTVEAEKKTSPPFPAAPPSQRPARPVSDAATAEGLIRSWANGDGRATVESWIDKAKYSPGVHGPVRDEITKFVACYIENADESITLRFRRDPLAFFKNKFTAWLINAKHMNASGKQAAAATSTTYAAPKFLNQ